MSGSQGQLTYSSFDIKGARGGWQVKEAINLPEGVSQADVVARVTTVLQLAEAVPQFPTAEDRQGFPRRVLYGRIGPWLTLWHSVPAGADATGRQDNVFTHVLVGISGRRPAEFATSKGWLTPFGAQEVAAATLSLPPRPADLVPRVQAFLDLGPGWPLGTLSVIADAVAASLEGGPITVVLAESTEEALNWLSALSVCLSANTAAKILFCTLDRASSAASWRQQGLSLVFVPTQDRDALGKASDIVLIDPRGRVEVGEPGHLHQCGTTHTIRATEWSLLIMDQLGDLSELPAVLADIDRLASRIGDDDLSPVWPLAMRGAELNRSATQRSVAIALAQSTPGRLESCPDLYAMVSRAIRVQMGETTAECWETITSIGSGASSLILQLAALVYAESAFQDATWLAREGSIPIPSASIRPQLTQHAVDALRAGADSLTGRRVVERTRAAIHMLTLAASLGFIETPAAESSVQILLDHILDGLTSTDADEVITTSGPLGELAGACISNALRLSVTPDEGALGRRVPWATIDYLGLRDFSLMERDDWLYNDAGRFSGLAAELAVGLLEHENGLPSLIGRNCRLVASDTFLRYGSEGDLDGHVSRLLDQQQFFPLELDALLKSFGADVPERWLARTLLCASESEELGKLARRITESWSYSHQVRALSEFRTTGKLQSVAPGNGDVELVSQLVNEHLGGDFSVVDPGLCGRLHLETLIAYLQGLGERPSVYRLGHRALAEADVRRAAQSLNWITETQSIGCILYAHPGSPERRLPAPVQEWVASLTVQGSESLAIDALFSLALERVPDSDYYELYRSVQGPSEKFVKAWLHRARPRRLFDRLGGMLGLPGGEL